MYVYVFVYGNICVCTHVHVCTCVHLNACSWKAEVTVRCLLHLLSTSFKNVKKWYVYEYTASMYVCLVPEEVRRGLWISELELQIVLSCGVGARNWTQVLGKTNSALNQ